MERKTPQSRKLIVSVLGTALALPLIAVPASAALDGGRFFVHAQNIESPEYEATAGMGGLNGSGGGSGTVPGENGGDGSGTTPGDGSGGGTTPGGGTGGGGTGGGSTPGDGSGGTVPGGGSTPELTNPGGSNDRSAVLATYTVGPMSFKVTEAMVDFTEANRKLQEEGNTAGLKTTTDGWQSVYYRSPTDGKMTLGFPEDGTKPSAVYLSSTMAAPQLGTSTPKDTVLMMASLTSLTDTRSPEAGKVFRYENNGNTEGRYLQEDGRLVAVSVARQTHDGALVVSRKESPFSQRPAVSDRYPFSLRKAVDGGVSIEMASKTAVDGSNFSRLSRNADGSGSGSYSYWNGEVDSYGSMGRGVTPAKRSNNPNTVSHSADGRVTGISGPNGYFLSGQYNIAPSDYNAATGQNWDGSYPKATDYDTTVPFEPGK